MTYTKAILQNLSQLSDGALKEMGIDYQCLAQSLQETEQQLDKSPSYRRIRNRQTRLAA